MTEVVIGFEFDDSGLQNGIDAGFEKATKKAADAGAKAGDAFNDAATDKLQLDAAVQKQLQEAAKLAAKAGADAGDRYGKDAGKAIGTNLKDLLPDGWEQGRTIATKAGGLAGGLYAEEGAIEAARKLASEFRNSWGKGVDVAGAEGSRAGATYGNESGDAVQGGLGRFLAQGWNGGQSAAASGGAAAGTTFADSAGDGVVGMLPGGIATAFQQGQGIASGAGGDAGEAFGAAASQSIGARQDLFQALIIQADKAAKDVGLIFNKVDLSFRVPDGGVLPPAVLDQLRQADAQLDNVVMRLGEFSVAANNGVAVGDRLGGSFDGLGQQAGLMDGIIQGVAFSLANTLTNAAGQAIGSLGAAVSTFSQLDAEIRLAAAAAGEAGAYDSLSGTISQVGIEAAGSTLEVAKLSTELLRGGMSVDEANASLGAIVRGAEATGTAYAQMGAVVTASIKGFGLEASDAQRVVDALTQGANSSAASVEGLGNAFKYSAPVAKILGLEVEDVAIATGLMTNAGIDAAEAGVTLRNGLSKLASAAPAAGDGVGNLTGQSAQAAAAMKQLGVDIYNTDGTLKPMEDTLLQLKGAFDLLDPASKIRLASNLFGGEDDGTKFLALLNQSEEEIKRMSAAMSDTQGATDRARDAMEGWQLKMQALQGTLEKMIGDVGSVIVTALTPFLEATNLVIGALANMPAPIQDGVIALTLLAGALGAVVIAQASLQAALKTTIVLETVQQYKTLSAGLSSVAATAIPSLVAAWQSLTAAMAAVQIPTIASMITTLGGVASQAGVLLAGMASSLATVPAAIAAISSAISGFLVAAAPVAAVVGSIVAIFATYNEIMSEANAIQKNLNPETGALAKKMEELDVAQQGVFQSAQNWITTLPGIREFVNAIRDAKTDQAVVALSNSMNQFQANTALAQSEAGELVAKIKTLPAGQVLELAGEVKETRDMLVAAREDTEKYIKSLEGMATAARAAGDTRLADEYDRRATSLKADLGLTTERLKQMDEEVKKNKQLAEEMEKIGKTAAELTEWRKKLMEQDVAATLALEAEVYTEVANRITTQQAAQISLRDATLDSIKKQMEALKQQLAQQADAARNDKENAENRKAYAELQKQYAEEQMKLTGEIIEAEKELNRVIAEAPVRSLTESLEFGAKLTEYAKAASDYEQARYDTAKARNDYELSQAEKRGASEQEIEAIRQRGDEISKASLLARAQALDTQIAIEQRSLEITQQKALLEANLEINEAKVKLLEQESAYQAALLSGNEQLIQLESNKRSLAQESLGLVQGSLEMIQQSIPLEQQTLALRQGAAQEALKAEGAAKGMNIQFANSIAPLTNANTLAAQYAGQWVTASGNVLAMSRNVQDSTGYVDAFGQRVNVAAGNVATIATEAGSAKYAIEQAADGSVRIKQVFSEAATSAGGLSSKVGDATGATRGLVTQTGLVPGGLDEAVLKTREMEKQMQLAQMIAVTTAGSTREIGTEARGAATEVQGVTTQADTIGDPLRAAQIELAKAKDEAERWRLKVAETESKFADTQTAVGGVTAKLEDTKTATDKIQQSPLEQFFLDVAKRGLGPVEQGLLTALQKARDLAKEENVGLLEYFGNVASKITSSIGSAIQSMISKAQELAGLLFGGKWAGGDVAAGSTWTVNEFGQEAFLSASGGLSLINRPAFGSWTAPSKGLVIPAGITSELKAAGAFDRGAAPMAAVFGGKMGVAAPAGVSSHTVNHVTIAAAEPVDSAARLMMNVARIRARGRRF